MEVSTSPGFGAKAGQSLQLKFDFKSYLLIIATLCFWSAYIQFNSYFSLYAKDWLNSESLVGLTFGLNALLVAIFSFYAAEVRILQKYIWFYGVLALSIFGLGWWAISVFPGFKSVCLYVLGISLSECLLATYFNDKWTQFNPGRKHLAQSLNFSFRNIGMGLGGMIGGVFYVSPKLGASLASWGFENITILLFSIFAILIIQFHEKKRGYRYATECLDI